MENTNSIEFKKRRLVTKRFYTSNFFFAVASVSRKRLYCIVYLSFCNEEVYDAIKRNLKTNMKNWDKYFYYKYRPAKGQLGESRPMIDISLLKVNSIDPNFMTRLRKWLVFQSFSTCMFNISM